MEGSGTSRSSQTLKDSPGSKDSGSRQASGGRKASGGLLGKKAVCPTESELKDSGGLSSSAKAPSNMSTSAAADLSADF